MALDKKELIQKIQDIESVVFERINCGISDTGLLTGGFGELVFLIENNSILDLRKPIEVMLKLINDSDNNSFCNGLGGAGWFVNYLVVKGLLDERESRNLLCQIDEQLYRSSIKWIVDNNTDFLYGAIGSGIYLLERVDGNKKARKYLKEIVRNLDEISLKDSRGIRWHESSFYQKNSNGVVNLGMPHGMVSIIMFLVKIVQNDIETELASNLLAGSVKYLFSKQNQNKGVSVFPSRITESQSPKSRLSWCYGDLSISIGLWHAGVVLNDQILKDEAIRICLKSTDRRVLDDTGVVDAGFCHGASGLAHMYLRMYLFSNVVKFKESAYYWLNETLKFAKFENGLAGYMKWNGKLNIWQNDFGIIEGVSGIGLVLIGFNSEKITEWDKCMLIK